MSFGRILWLAMLFPFVVVADDSLSDMQVIAAVIDDYHDAAAHGDKDRYLGHLTQDAVFMGTDEWERWPKHPDFTDYVSSRFKDGSGWNYQSVERNIQIAESANVAWFDEVLYSEANGRFRGTGVLILDEGKWLLAHYAMSFLILNENWEEVIELTRKTKAFKESE